eukprot:TRINITY_DN60782_c0_g1_i1.p1 TRINITY_DN60782_c0_g1~~TRINITY_DN60782_c0_g1_i1.p1  ORF type:complete len:424 (+),score=60.25 TRINITY_DN60782_c0_g1_i1:190-1272(+)
MQVSRMPVAGMTQITGDESHLALGQFREVMKTASEEPGKQTHPACLQRVSRSRTRCPAFRHVENLSRGRRAVAHPNRTMVRDVFAFSRRQDSDIQLGWQTGSSARLQSDVSSCCESVANERGRFDDESEKEGDAGEGGVVDYGSQADVKKEVDTDGQSQTRFRGFSESFREIQADVADLKGTLDSLATLPDTCRRLQISVASLLTMMGLNAKKIGTLRGELGELRSRFTALEENSKGAGDIRKQLEVMEHELEQHRRHPLEQRLECLVDDIMDSKRATVDAQQTEREEIFGTEFRSELLQLEFAMDREKLARLRGLGATLRYLERREAAIGEKSRLSTSPEVNSGKWRSMAYDVRESGED